MTCYGLTAAWYEGGGAEGGGAKARRDEDGECGCLDII